MKNILREILNCESYCEMYHIETTMSYVIKNNNVLSERNEWLSLPLIW